MAQLKEIRTRIASVKNTMQVTNAMKMVSAAKLKKAQDLISVLRPYDDKLYQILQSLSSGGIAYESPYFKQKELKKALIIIVGSNRGLCGAFNVNIVKYALNAVIKKYPLDVQEGKVKFLPIGRQVEKQLKLRGIPIVGEANDILNNHDFEDSAEFTTKLMEWFSESEFQNIDIIYNKFKNAAIQLHTIEQFLPVKALEEKEQDETLIEYIFEPGKEEILTKLIPDSLKMQFHRILLDSNAAEQGARMTAMFQATENGGELLKDLKTSYNNARQAAITNEIIEITSGADALGG